MGQAPVDLPDPHTAARARPAGAAPNPPAKGDRATAPAANSPDDLLAQLAGDEIDRMLAAAEDGLMSDPLAEARPVDGGERSDPETEALDLLDAIEAGADEIEKAVGGLTADAATRAADAVAREVAPPTSAVPALAPPPSLMPGKPDPGTDPLLEAELDALFGELSKPIPSLEGKPPSATVAPAGPKPVVAPVVPPAPPRAVAIPTAPVVEPVTDPALAAELDDLFQQLNAPLPSAAPAPVDPVGAAMAELAADAPAQQPTTPPAPVVPAATTAVDTESAPPLTADLSAVLDPIVVADEAVAHAVPVYLKPLVWMNAPLDALPDGARGLMGKAAIITLINATAILIYVALFRQ